MCVDSRVDLQFDSRRIIADLKSGHSRIELKPVTAVFLDPGGVRIDGRSKADELRDRIGDRIRRVNLVPAP